MELLKQTPENSCPVTPLTFLERAATVYGGCTSILYNSANNTTVTYTWSQTHQRCLKLASSIVAFGIDRCNVVSIVAPNIPAMYEVQFAVPMTGAVLNTINIRLNAATISTILRHGESKLVFVDYQYKTLVLEAISLFPPEVHRPKLVLIADNEPSDTNEDSDDRKYMTYEGMVESGDPEFSWVQPVSEWDPMTLNYTSGTTSAPKGVVHSHRALFIMTLGSLIDWSMPKRPVYLWTVPMFHTNGWSFSWGTAVVGGINICIRKAEPGAIYMAIKTYGVTHMCGAPIILNMLVNFPGARKLRYQVQFLTSGAPPPASLIHSAESLGFVVSHAYGLTEMGGIVASCAWKPEWDDLADEERATVKSRQGVRTAWMSEMQVMESHTGDRYGERLGEIALRGGSLMLGYLKDPEATKKCMKGEGWLYTGDVGVINTEGYLEIKDRSKDIIISGGENVCSLEVESVLGTHVALDDVAVVAKPDEFWGETPCAFVCLKGDIDCKPTEEEIIRFCREKLPHYMAPKMVVFVKELPKTATGKVEKSVLRERAKALYMTPANKISH